MKEQQHFMKILSDRKNHRQPNPTPHSGTRPMTHRQ